MVTLHKNLTGSDLHAINTWVYLDSTARGIATGFSLDDKGKIAWQMDNNTFWVLINHNPITWQALGAVNPLMESIIPDMTNASGTVSNISIGTPTKKINSIYTSELFLDASSLYVNDKKVLEDDSGTITVSTDVGEDLRLLTTGGGDIRLTSENEVNIDATGGVEVTVPADAATKHINISNNSAGGNMTFYALGTGAQVQFSAVDEIDLTAPIIDFNGEVQFSSPVTLPEGSIDKTDVGLGNVPNLDCTNANNITSGILSSSVLPPIAITSTFVVNGEAAQLALTVEEGDVVVRTDENKSYIHNGGSAGDMADWTELQTPTDAVLSVNTKTGTIVLTQDDVGNGSTYVQTENNLTDSLLGKLNGVENGATGDQTASEILTLLKTVDGVDSGLEAETAGSATTASKLSNSRSVSLSGDVTGSTSFDGSSNVTIATTVGNDSHTHDGRYFTETEADARFLGITSKASDSDKLDGQEGSYYTNYTDSYHSWEIKTGNFTAVTKKKYFVDTSSSAITVTLPSLPSLGDSVKIVDGASKFGTNNCIVARNGQKIMGLSENMTIDTNNVSVELVYSNITNGWRLC